MMLVCVHLLKTYRQMKVIVRIRQIIIALALMALTSCTNCQPPSVAESDGYNSADSIVSDIGDARDFPRLLEVTDSLERLGELPLVRSIFYKTIAYNLMGKHRTALSLYYKLTTIPAEELKCQADIECYIYSSKDYIRLLCDMRRYDRALREVQHADRTLKAAGYDTFMDHHDIAQMIGESQLYLDKVEEAGKSFQKSLQSIKERLAVHDHPIDLLECQKTMNAITRAYIRTGRYDEAIPWLERQDSLFTAADTHPSRDSVFVDEMKAEINYSKALLAHALGRTDEAERAFAEYQTTQTAKGLGSIINSCEYLLLSHRYDEAARNFTQLDRYLKESGYKADLDNIGRFMIPKYRANMLAGNRDSALRVATLVAEYYDTALVRQKISDADLLATIYDTEGKERQIAEQRAELSQQRLWTVVIVSFIFIVFVLFYMMQRRKAFRELNEKNRQLILANERAEESNRMRAKFIEQISHEVRTPLNILSGFSQVLANFDIDIDYDEIQECSKKVVENSERITHLMNKMIELSLVNNDSAIECCDTVTPADVVAQAVKESRIRKVDHLEFQQKLSPEAESLTFVTSQMSAVKAVAQLLDNAIKFTSPVALKGHQTDGAKPRVMLSVDVVGQQVVFTVEDTGIGVPPEEAENIFTEFVQLDEYADGMGIGLSIARSVIRRMNGDIILDTSYTDGARFVLSLPLHAESV